MTAARPSSTAADAFGWRFTTPLLMGSALNPINSSLIATALVPIAAAVHVPVARTAVLVSALYLASAIAQPTGGKLAEELGPRRVFVLGILTVLVGGLVGGFGQDLTMLVVSRVLIGVGTSAGYPSAMLLIRRRAEAAGLREPPGGVLGGLVIAGAATAALGLPLGGVLVDAWGWRTTFFVNLPMAAAALAMTLTWIPRDEPAERPRHLGGLAARLDLAGIAGFGGALSALLVFLMGLPRTDWAALGVAVVVGTALVRWELRCRVPFFDIRLLARNVGLTRTYLRFALAALCVYTVMYGVSQWLEAGRHLSPQATGLLLLPMGALSALLARPVSQRNLIRGPLFAAALSCVAASAGVLFLTTTTSIGWIVVITLLFGITLGTTVSANQTTLYTQVAANQIGTASGLFRTFGYIGSIASSAIIAIGFHGGVSDAHLHSIALVMVIVSVVGVLVVLADRAVMSQVRAGSPRRPSPPGIRDDDFSSEHSPAPTPGPSPTVTRGATNLATRRDPTMTLSALDPTPALVVIDVQKGLQAAPTVHPFHEIAERAGSLAGAFRAKGLPVVLVNVTGGAPGRTEVGSARSGGTRSPDWAELVDTLDPQPGDHRVTKARWGAFHGTSLDDDLRRLGVTQVVLAGVATSIGVESTARAAYEHGYHVVLAVDAMTDLDPDAHHNSVQRIFPRLGERATTGELVELLNRTLPS